MTRVLTRTNLHSSSLIRVLTDLSILDTVEPGIAFAEKLGRWVNFTDAITLSTVLNASTASPPGMQLGAPSAAGVAVDEALARVRATLEKSIMTRGLPTPSHDVPMEVATGYEPYRRYYCAHQRDMDLSVRPLRAKVRQALSGASPALKQLAALDEALERVLSERESKLLATVPVLLGRRFEQLRKAHPQGTWLARFCQELQAVLLAELDVRLQPTLGLMEALNHETTQHK